MIKSNEEFGNFDRTMRKLVTVPHSEVKAKLDAEKTAKNKKRKARKPSALPGTALPPKRIRLSEGPHFLSQATSYPQPTVAVSYQTNWGDRRDHTLFAAGDGHI